MKIDRDTIARLVPHAGSMCLLDEVRHWSPTAVACIGAAPGPHHPLARNGRLSAVVLAEYAAQATAVHGALLEGGSGARAGMLAALVDVELSGSHGSEDGELLVEADLLSRSRDGCLYAFAVRNSAATLVTGRLMIALAASEAAP
jgi:predicted hotdog family 3-hydroxylacyl-ACP dehydratase